MVGGVKMMDLPSRPVPVMEHLTTGAGQITVIGVVWLIGIIALSHHIHHLAVLALRARDTDTVALAMEARTRGAIKHFINGIIVFNKRPLSVRKHRIGRCRSTGHNVMH